MVDSFLLAPLLLNSADTIVMLMHDITIYNTLGIAVIASFAPWQVGICLMRTSLVVKFIKNRILSRK
jgi:hypothetical protein